MPIVDFERLKKELYRTFQNTFLCNSLWDDEYTAVKAWMLSKAQLV